LLVRPIALDPLSFCQNIGQQPPPSMPVIQGTEDNNTSSSQPDAVHGQTSVLHDFDLNKEYTGA